jgi:hypothetical protein
MDRPVATVVRTVGAAIALIAALLATIAAFANLLIPATVLSVCSESFTDDRIFYWRGAGFMLGAALLWSAARMLGSEERSIRVLSIILLIIIGVLAALTWSIAGLEFTDPDQSGPSCPDSRRGTATAAAAIPALAPLLAIAIAEASAWPARLPWWSRTAIVLAGELTLAAALVLVLGEA